MTTRSHSRTPFIIAAAGATLFHSGHALALTPDQAFQQISPSVVTVRALNANETPISTGSGVVIAPQTVVTNCHVIAKSKYVQIKQGRVIYEAKLEYPDPERDLCQIKVPDLNAKPVVLAKSIATNKVGERVYAIGSPMGLELTLSEGIVSGLRDVFEDGIPVIQTTAAISKGSSGGGLFNHGGQLIGITTFQHKYGQNLNFALPVDWIRDIPARAKEILNAEKNSTPAAAPAATQPTAPKSTSLSESELSALVGRELLVVGLNSIDKLSLSRSGWFNSVVAGSLVQVTGLWKTNVANGLAQICLSQRSGILPGRGDISGCYEVQRKKNGQYLFRAPVTSDD